MKNPPFNSSMRTLPVPLEAGETAEVFLKVQNFNSIDIPFTLTTKDYLIDHYQSYSLLQGIFFGVVIVVMFYNLVLYFLIRFSPYLYYIAYIIFISIYFLSYYGYFHRFTTIDPVWIYMFLGTSAIGFIVSVTYFMSELFLFKQHIPLTYKTLKAVLVYFAVFVVSLDMAIYLDSFYYSQLFFTIISISLPIYAVLILYGLYFIAYKKRVRLL